MTRRGRSIDLFGREWMGAPVVVLPPPSAEQRFEQVDLVLSLVPVLNLPARHRTSPLMEHVNK